jgi:biopolymer transport protein ExbD
MGYENHPSSGSAATVIAVLAVVLIVLLVGLFVLGIGAFFFVRTESRQAQEAMQVEMVARERAMAAQRLAEERMAEARAVAEATQEGVKIVVLLDADGTIRVNGNAITPDALKEILQTARQHDTIAVTAAIQVDGRCPFRHVTALQEVCREAGATTLVTTVEAGKSNSPESPSPTPTPEATAQ